ncbi:histone-lysine N-methyltransferase [Salix suchowensis]|nr:histone-lysine N-methyltransferase [Salix suchowensis]
MAFHVACPITCRRICFCSLGFTRDLHSTKSKADFLFDVARIDEFLKDPFGIRVSREGTVLVSVPKVLPVPVTIPPSHTLAVVSARGRGSDGGVVEEAVSAQTKRVAIQEQAAATKASSEYYAKKVASKDIPGEDVGPLCQMCSVGGTGRSERARKMLPCKICGKKYHRSCLKTWASHRDLFHWSSWTCPSCRTCEVCRKTGDPNKFMFCKRCDSAYHCYCQHPSHKNVSSGPYLCPEHTRCHSCGSSVPGNGLSVRWFLGYTCCDACGRLFVKGNYCPVCLKVYRDSESTPMVCLIYASDGCTVIVMASGKRILKMLFKSCGGDEIRLIQV